MSKLTHFSTEFGPYEDAGWGSYAYPNHTYT